MISVGKDEKIEMKMEKHWMYWVFPIIFIVTIPLALYRLIRYKVDEIVLTNRKFYISAGFISKEMIVTPIDKINNIYYEIGILGRMFGYGTLCISSGGVASAYPYIKKPQDAQMAIENVMQQLEETKNQKLAKTLSGNQ